MAWVFSVDPYSMSPTMLQLSPPQQAISWRMSSVAFKKKKSPLMIV